MSLRIDFNAPGVLRKGLEKNRKGMTGTGQTLKKKENRRTKSRKETEGKEKRLACGIVDGQMVQQCKHTHTYIMKT